MKTKKIAAFAAAAVIAAGICTGLPMDTGNNSPLAVTASAETYWGVKDFDMKVTFDGVRVKLEWDKVEKADHYLILFLYYLPEEGTKPEKHGLNFAHAKCFKMYTVPKDEDTSLVIETQGLPLAVNGESYHYAIMITPHSQAVETENTALGAVNYYFDSLDDLDRAGAGTSTDSAGNTSAGNSTPQKTVTGENKFGLKIPDNYSATGGDKKITVKWDKVAGAKSYKVYYCEAGKNEFTDSVTTSSTSCTITGLTNGKAYDIMIQPDNSGNQVAILQNVLVGGDTDTGKTEKTQESTKVAAPTGFKASKTKNSVTLSWSESEGADAYRVYIYNAETGKYEKYKDVKSAKCTITGLSANTKYKFKVVAYDKVDGKYVKGGTSKAVSVTTKK